MTKRHLAPLLILAASLAAQEPVPEKAVLRAYDLGPLASGTRSLFFGEGVGAAQRDFTLLGATHKDEGSREGDVVTDGMPEGSQAQMVTELVRAFGVDAEVPLDIEQVDGSRQLLVRTREAQHKTIARILEQLRGPGDPPVEIEVRHLSLLDRSLDDQARAALQAPGKLDADQIALLARHDLHGGRQAGILHVVLGRWGVYRAVRELRYLPDFDVEVAQAAAIADPLPAIATDGVKAAVRPFLLRDGRLLLRIVASAGDLEGEPRRVSLDAQEVDDQLRLRNTDYGYVEQCDYRGGAVSTEAVVTVGKTAAVVLATQAGTDVRWDVLAFTVKAAPRPAQADSFLVAPVGALVAADAVRTLAWNGTTGELALLAGDQGPTARLGFDDVKWNVGTGLEGETDFRTTDDYLYGGCLFIRASPANVRAAVDGITELEREMIRPVQIEIRLVSDRGREAPVVGMLAGPLTAGRTAALASYRRMDTVGDYQVEIAQEARIADPEPQVVTAGAFANVTLFANADGTYRMHLDLSVLGVPDGIRTIASQVGGVPILQGVALRKRVDPIRLDIGPGKPRTIDLGPDPFIAGEEGRLVATVTVQ